MRLFVYYAVHSVINTIKKLFKTWLAIILVCMVFGGVVGGIAGMIFSDDEEEITQEVETSEEETETLNFIEARGFEKNDFVDMIVSLGFLGLVAFNVLNAKNSGNLFKPGDVVMLFASPLKPQSVMMFRLMGSIGMSILISIYMIFQVPNLILNVGLTTWGAFAIIVAFGLTIIIGTLFQVTFYTLSSRAGRKTGNFTTAIAAFYGIIAAAYVAFTVVDGGDYLSCAIKFFAGKKTFWVPFWGWVRGLCYYAGKGETLKSLIYLGVFIIGSALLVWFIWNIDCDFYEDAITSAEKQAATLESTKQAAKGGIVARKKERKGEINRDGFAYGFGANVFFFKAVYNRFRFAKLKVFSTTSLVYLGVTALAVYIAKDVEGIDPFIIIACVLGVMVFYRTLGNPLEEDTTKAFFIMAPEKASAKLFYSLMGGETITLIDLVIPFVGAAIFFSEDPLSAIAWLLFIISIDFFGTCVGTFIAISVPGEAGQTAKTTVQIMFLYFGLIPAAVFVVVGIILSKIFIFVLIGAIIEVLIGSIFFALIPRFLENGNK